MAGSPKHKRRKEGNDLNDRGNKLVRNFMKWCQDVGLSLNEKVTVGENGSCHRFGMIAVDKLDEGECVFQIPRKILLEPNTSSISEIIAELKNNLPENNTRHQWLPLLVTLLYEYTQPRSKWRPYLDLLPNEDVLNQPIFWTKQEREYLNLIDMKHLVDDDLKYIEEGYSDYVIPFMKKHEKYFDAKVHTLQLYKRLAGFVMAYSFTDYGSNKSSAKPAMVPMADILNHISDNNAHLEFGEEYLSMVTTQPIEKGCEVFNTYGALDNCNLLRSYGFIEECPNPYDQVEIPMKIFQEILKLTDEVWRTKLTRFQEQNTDMFKREGLLFDVNGCICSEERLHEFLKVIHEDNTDPATNEVNHEDDKAGQNESEKNSSDNVKGDVEDILEKEQKSKCVDHKRNSGMRSGECHASDILEEEWEEHWESDTDDEQENGDEPGGNCEDTGSDDEDNEWDSDSSSESTDGAVTHDELLNLAPKWRQTLSRAAKLCARNIKDLSEELSNGSTKSTDTRRESMVRNISQGRLCILKQVEQLIAIAQN